MFDKNGKELARCEMSDCNIVGVTVDRADDCVFVVSSKMFGSNKIIKLTPDLKVLKFHKSNCFFASGMAAAGDKVVACDETQMLMYTKELAYVKRITPFENEDLSHIRMISSNECNNFYVIGTKYNLTWQLL